jgi:hypothetical protein
VRNRLWSEFPKHREGDFAPNLQFRVGVAGVGGVFGDAGAFEVAGFFADEFGPGGSCGLSRERSDRLAAALLSRFLERFGFGAVVVSFECCADGFAEDGVSVALDQGRLTEVPR